VHVEADEHSVGQIAREPRRRQRLVVWDAELVAALCGLDVVVRRLDCDLRIHAQRHASCARHLSRKPVQEKKLSLRLDVEE
jgi:hypothetical protein